MNAYTVIAETEDLEIWWIAGVFLDGAEAKNLADKLESEDQSREKQLDEWVAEYNRQAASRGSLDAKTLSRHVSKRPAGRQAVGYRVIEIPIGETGAWGPY